MYSFKNIELSRIACNERLKDRDDNEIEESFEFLELMASISDVGLLQPICVEKSDDGYSLLFGKRRFYAFLHLNEAHGEKYATIPAIILDPKDSNKEYPVEVKILHENKYRQDIRRDNYIESSIALFPKFVSQNNSISFKEGLVLVEELLSVHNKESGQPLDRERVEFLNAIDKFLEFTKIKIVELERYKKLLHFDSDIRDLFYCDAIYFSDAVLLEDFHKENPDEYKKCLKDIDKDASKVENNHLIKKYVSATGVNNVEETIKFLSNKLRVIKRVSKGIKELDKKEQEKAKELMIELELLFKNQKEKNEKNHKFT